MEEPLKPNEFRCCECGEIFENAWSEEEAQSEVEQKFGLTFTEQNCATMCEDCYRKFMQKTFS
jgi:uncharacterized protein with PIN domain